MDEKVSVVESRSANDEMSQDPSLSLEHPFEFVNHEDVNSSDDNEDLVLVKPQKFEQFEFLDGTESENERVNAAPLVILSSSHDQSKPDDFLKIVDRTESMNKERSPTVVDQDFIKKLIHDAYEASGEHQPFHMENENESWQPCAQSSPAKEKNHKIYLRELSFDELKDVKGVDLLAPVFLAVTEEADDNVKDLRRKAKSIEDLCSTAFFGTDDSFSRQRSKSALSASSHRGDSSCHSHDTNFHELVYDNDFHSNLVDIKQGLTSLTMSITSDDNPVSTTSDQYNESIDDSYEDQAILDMFANHGMYDAAVTDESSFDMLKDTEESSDETIESKGDDGVPNDGEEEIVENSQKRPLSVKLFENAASVDLTRTPTTVPASTCGFWEYPYGDEPSSPQKTVARQLSINTSPKSSLCVNSLNDRFVVVNVAGQQRVVDMSLIEKYLKVITHGGHHTVENERRVLVVFSACYLPASSIEKYNIVMEQLFYYFIHAVDLLVVDAYEIVYFNSPVDGKNMPAREWIKKCYHMVNYRLKKNLRNIYFVHQSLWIKTLLRFSKLFVSSKFRRKIHFVKNIKTLKKYVPLEYIYIPPETYNVDKAF